MSLLLLLEKDIVC